MQESDWFLIIAVAEFALIVTLVLAVFGTRVFRRARRDSAAAEELVAKVKSTSTGRRNELESLLAQSYGLSGDTLKEKAHELERVEKHFYEQFIDTYLRRDAEGLAKTDERLKTVIAAYLQVRSEPFEAGGAVEAVAAAGEANDAEVANLKAMLNNLGTEMAAYRETLNKVFSEYTAMFGVHLDPRQQLSAKEIMARLESGQLAGQSAEESEAPMPDV